MNLGDTRGIVKSIDVNGRLVIPKDFMKSLNITNNNPVEIFLLNDGMFIKKYN